MADTSRDGPPIGTAILLVLAVVLYAGMMGSLSDALNSDAMGRGLALAFGAILGTALVAVLAVLLLIAAINGSMSPWGKIGASTLLPLAMVAMWNAGDAWTPVTSYRERKGAHAAIFAVGAPSFLAGAASDRLAEQGTLVDVYVINGFPLDEAFVNSLPAKYGRLLTIEDGLIGTVDAGLRGFAAYVAGHFAGCGLTLDHLGIVDPQIAPSDHYLQVWEHYGMTADAIVERIRKT